MILEEFQARGAAIAADLGVPPLSARQIRDLVDEGVLPNPDLHGRGRGRGVGREWSEEALGDLGMILRLRKLGERRADQAKAYLWIIGRPVAFDMARPAIRAEFKRLVARERRRLGKTEGSLNALARRIGAAHPALVRLAPSMQAAGEMHVEAVPAIIWGSEGDRDLDRSLSANPDLGAAFSFAREFMIPFFSGVLGDTEETDQSAVTALETANEEVLTTARSIAQAIFLGWGFVVMLTPDEPPGLREDLQSVDRAEWAIGLFALAVNALVKAPGSWANLGAKLREMF